MATTGLDLSQVQQSTTNAALAQTGNLNNYIEQLAGVQAANNAVSAQMAADQREWSAEQAELTRRFNAAEAVKNRDWQQMMSNTAHQREIKDLQAAGLNPVLSAMGGNGASVTSGATASASNPNGASSQADTSLTGAIVSLLGTSLKTMTDIASMSTSALTNQSVADKYTAAQMAAAEMSSSASRYGADRSVESAMIHAAATEFAASLQSEATRYAAGLSSAATRYASDNAYAASRYASNNARAASNYSVNKHTAATRYGADQSYAASKYATDRNFTASSARTAQSGINTLFGQLFNLGQWLGGNR